MVYTVPVLVIPVGMYHIGTYTGIEMPALRIGLNTGRNGHTGRFWVLLPSIFFFFLVL